MSFIGSLLEQPVPVFFPAETKQELKNWLLSQATDCLLLGFEFLHAKDSLRSQ